MVAPEEKYSHLHCPHNRNGRKGEEFMKSWICAALEALIMDLFIISAFCCCSDEYAAMPGIVRFVSAFSLLILLAYALVIFRSMHRDRQARKKELMAQRVRQTEESRHFSDTPSPDDILYLRPFHVDDQYTSQVEYAGNSYNSIESVICRMLTDSGHPVAIGKPGETLQPLGAHRVYAADDEWKKKVTQYLEHSRCVILYVDFTPGVKWEIETSLAGYADKLILIPKVYNQRASAFRLAALSEPTGLLYPIYSLWCNHFFSKKSHRGKAYYKSWQESMKSHFDALKADDRLSAVIFQNGKAVPFYAAKPNHEAQFRAIHRAINAKLGIQSQPDLFLQKNEKPLLVLRSDLGANHAAYAQFIPYAMGRVEFYEKGLRYRSAIGFSRFNLQMKYHYKTLERYKKNQLIPYSSIRDIVSVKENCLRLILEEVNGSLDLIVPTYHWECIPEVKQLLEKCCAAGSFCADEAAAAVSTQLEKDYAKAFGLVEAFSLVLGGLLLLLAAYDNFTAYFCLLALGGIWNLTIAITDWFLTLKSRSLLIRTAGILASVIHLVIFSLFYL